MSASVSLNNYVASTTQTGSFSSSSNVGAIGSKPVYHFQKGDLFYLNADQNSVDNTNAKVQRFFLQKVTKITTFKEDFAKASEDGRLVFYTVSKNTTCVAIHMKWCSNYAVNRAASGFANKTNEGREESFVDLQIMTENGYLSAQSFKPLLLTEELYQKLAMSRKEISNLLPSKQQAEPPPASDCCVIL